MDSTKSTARSAESGQYSTKEEERKERRKINNRD
jgi:hypothetical protein